jgi:uncharacterized membrane protein
VQAYGRTTYLVTTFKLVPRGTEGAVSLEGTLAGVAAAALFAGVALAVGQVRSARVPPGGGGGGTVALSLCCCCTHAHVAAWVRVVGCAPNQPL